MLARIKLALTPVKLALALVGLCDSLANFHRSSMHPSELMSMHTALADVEGLAARPLDF
jgi:hypothetical protein